MLYKLQFTKNCQICVVISSPKSELPPVLAPFIEQVKSQPAFTLSQVESFSEIANQIPEKTSGAIVILCIQDKDEFVSILQFLSSNETSIQKGNIKVFVFSRIENPRVFSILKSKGVFDIPDFSIALKAFGYKIQKAVQGIEQSIEIGRKQTSNEASNAAIKAGRISAGPRSVGTQHQVLWEKPIEHFSDFWILLSQRHARHVIGKWMINFYGPGPSSGVWESTDLEENGEKGWIFNPRNPTDTLFYKDSGRWVFFGNCPEFSWEQRNWYFISKRPALYFYYGNEIGHKKLVCLDSGDIQLHSNSEAGKTQKALITSTIEASIRLRADRDKSRGNVLIETESKELRELSAELGADQNVELRYEDQQDGSTHAADYRDQLDPSPDVDGHFAAEPLAPEIALLEESYSSTELAINLTSKNGVKMTNHDPIRLVELRKTQAAIDIPIGLLAVGDQFEFEANVQSHEGVSRIAFSAATRIIEPSFDDEPGPDHDRAAAICDLNQALQGHFTEVVDQLQAKRELLDQFFRKAKGV